MSRINDKHFGGKSQGFSPFFCLARKLSTDTASEAHVVLPAASYIEQDGSYTACDGRVQKVNRILKPKNGMENWKIIQTLAVKFDKSFDYDSLEAVSGEIENVNRFHGGNGNGCFNKEGKPRFVTYEIDTATLNPELPTLLYSENYYKTKIKSQLR